MAVYLDFKVNVLNLIKTWRTTSVIPSMVMMMRKRAVLRCKMTMEVLLILNQEKSRMTCRQELMKPIRSSSIAEEIQSLMRLKSLRRSSRLISGLLLAIINRWCRERRQTSMAAAKAGAWFRTSGLEDSIRWCLQTLWTLIKRTRMITVWVEQQELKLFRKQAAKTCWTFLGKTPRRHGPEQED